jgi:3-hydroxyacyl-[acyl-carrier-protein] dehydratase
MRFSQLDQITELVPGKRITAVKRLSASEQYLEDHFPRFPVMPGVLMLEAMFQAAMWLVRQSDGFAHSMVVLKEARNVKYADFVEPGETLVVSAEIVKDEHEAVTLKTQGMVDDKVAVNARLIVERFNLADRFPNRAATDPYLRNESREQMARLLKAGPAAS